MNTCRSVNKTDQKLKLFSYRINGRLEVTCCTDVRLKQCVEWAYNNMARCSHKLKKAIKYAEKCLVSQFVWKFAVHVWRHEGSCFSLRITATHLEIKDKSLFTIEQPFQNCFAKPDAHTHTPTPPKKKLTKSVFIVTKGLMLNYVNTISTRYQKTKKEQCTHMWHKVSTYCKRVKTGRGN